MLKPIIRGACAKSSRPNLALFKMRIKSVKGCPGADGWSREEIMAVSRCNIAAKLVWDSMQIWEQFGLSPTAAAHCKMVMIPKKDLRAISPSAFRPIAVQSAWWRAWSSTWLRSKIICSWVQKTYPRNVSRTFPGSYGPEVMAAILDYKLAEQKHGVTLDLKHAFDSVQIDLVEEVFLRILPRSNHCWISLLFWPLEEDEKMCWTHMSVKSRCALLLDSRKEIHFHHWFWWS